MSATLGGYDSARFVPHDNAFTLEQGESIPHTLVRGIQVAANKSRDRPDVWSSPIEILSDWNSSFTAMIDSSTPYLWLPEPVCSFRRGSQPDLQQHLRALHPQQRPVPRLHVQQLTHLYFQPDELRQSRQLRPASRGLCRPLSAPFSILLGEEPSSTATQPFPTSPSRNPRMIPLSSAEPFSRNRTSSPSSTSLYSIHQALFPANPERDANLVPIRQPSNSPYPPPPKPHQNEELTTAQMAGITVGDVLLCTVIVAGYFYIRRKRRQPRRGKKSKDDVDDHNDSASTLAPDSPQTPVARILSKIACRKHSQSRRSAAGSAKAGKLNDHAGAGNQSPLEAPDCQIYELSASASPVELDAGGDRHSIGEMELGADNPQTMSSYELARRRMEAQLRGPVPVYSPPTDATMLQPEKAAPNPRLLDTGQTFQQISPTSPTRSGGGSSHSNTSPTPELSPVSPRADWHTYPTLQLPSPVAGSMPPRFPGATGSWVSQGDFLSAETARSNTENAVDVVAVPQSSFQRNTADYSKVIYLGPLPETLQKNQRDTLITRLTGPDGRGVSKSLFHATSRASEGSLGSNFTEEEEMIAEELTRQASRLQAHSSHGDRVSSHQSGRGLTPLHRMMQNRP